MNHHYKTTRFAPALSLYFSPTKPTLGMKYILSLLVSNTLLSKAHRTTLRTYLLFYLAIVLYEQHGHWHLNP